MAAFVFPPSIQHTSFCLITFYTSSLVRHPSYIWPRRAIDFNPLPPQTYTTARTPVSRLLGGCFQHRNGWGTMVFRRLLSLPLLVRSILRCDCALLQLHSLSNSVKVYSLCVGALFALHGYVRLLHSHRCIYTPRKQSINQFNPFQTHS